MALASAVLLLMTASGTAGFDAGHPRPHNLFYAVDALTGRAFWLSTDKDLDEWTRTFFPVNPVRRRLPELFGDGQGEFWAAAAPNFALPAPNIKVLADTTTANIRKIAIQVRSSRQAPRLSLSVEGAAVIRATVAGRVFSPAVRGEWRLKAFAIPEQGLPMELTVQAGSPFKIRVIDISYQLPPASFQPRPAEMMPQPFGLSDTSMVVNTIDFQ